jgi:hypothetical protein
MDILAQTAWTYKAIEYSVTVVNDFQTSFDIVLWNTKLRGECVPAFNVFVTHWGILDEMRFFRQFLSLRCEQLRSACKLRKNLRYALNLI